MLILIHAGLFLHLRLLKQQMNLNYNQYADFSSALQVNFINQIFVSQKVNSCTNVVKYYQIYNYS